MTQVIEILRDGRTGFPCIVNIIVADGLATEEGVNKNVSLRMGLVADGAEGKFTHCPLANA